MNRIISTAIIIGFSVLTSTLVQGEPFQAVSPSVLHIFAMDKDTVAVRFSKEASPVVTIRHEQMLILQLAIASALSLDDVLVIDLNHKDSASNPRFFVGRAKNSLADGWLIDARFVRSAISLNAESTSYFFDKQDGSPVIKIYEHAGLDSAFAKAFAQGSKGMIRVNSAAANSRLDAEFIPFANLAIFNIANISSFGSVDATNADNASVKLLLDVLDVTRFHTIGEKQRALAVNQPGSSERRYVKHFRLVGPRFAF